MFMEHRNTYIYQKLILQTEVFLKNMRWRAFWFDRKGDIDDDEVEKSHRMEITKDFNLRKPLLNMILTPLLTLVNTVLCVCI